MRLHRGYFHHDVHTFGDFTEHRVRGRRRFVEPIEEVVVDGVDEKLTPAGVFGAGICHRQSPGLVRDLRRQLVRNAAFSRVSRYFFLRGEICKL